MESVIKLKEEIKIHKRNICEIKSIILEKELVIITQETPFTKGDKIINKNGVHAVFSGFSRESYSWYPACRKIKKDGTVYKNDMQMYNWDNWESI